MASYRVEWAIDIFDATDPKDAARQAWEFMREPDSRTNVFDVIKHDSDGQAVRVDLDEEG